MSDLPESPVLKKSKLDPEATPFVGASNGSASPPTATRSAPSDPVPEIGYRYVLAWDIEKTGPRTDKHAMPALGAVVIRTADDREMDSIRIFFKIPEGRGFSEVCRKEYWYEIRSQRIEFCDVLRGVASNSQRSWRGVLTQPHRYDWEKFPMNKTVLKRIEEEGVEPQQGIQLFATWLDRQERTYGSQGLALTTDNPASDATWVGHYFQEYLDRNPMFHRYGSEAMKDYRRLHHSNAYGRCLSLDDGSDDGTGRGWCDRLREMGVKVPPNSLHDHDPLNDARWIALLYTACLRYVHTKRYGGVD